MKLRSCLVMLVLVLLAASAASARSAPAFSLPDAEGNKVSLSSFRGKYVVIEILQTTCPHCQRASKVLTRLAGEYPKNLQVIGIAMDGQNPENIRTFIRDQGATYPVVAGDMMVAMNYLGITPQRPNFHVPVFFVISPSGEIIEERNPDHAADRDWFANADQNLETMVRTHVPPNKPAAKGKAKSRKPAAKKS